MKFHVQTLKEIKNKRGEIKSKVVRITNEKTKDGLPFDVINQIYKVALKKHKASNLVITAKPMIGGWTTLKNINFNGENLKYNDDDYFNSLPKKIADKLVDKYYSIDLLINL
jgi:hypothetical protein